MRKHFPALFSAGLLATAANAQISINATDNLPSVGDTFTYNTAPYAAPPAGGAGQSFDFSGLTSGGTTEIQWLAPSVYSNADLFPSAQMAMVNGSDTILYTVTAQGLERVGERNLLVVLGQNVDLEIVHSNNMLELELPITFDGDWVDQVEGTVYSDGSTGTRNGVIQGDADAYGTITLPGGVSSSVLRVYTRINEVIQIPISGNPTDVVHKRHQYDYFVPWLKMPVLTSFSDSLVSFLTVVESGIRYMTADPVSVDENTVETIGFSLFPNPMQDAVTVSFSGVLSNNARLDVFDATGRELRSERIGAMNSQRTLSLAGEAPGCYFVRLRDENGTLVTRRLVKR